MSLTIAVFGGTGSTGQHFVPLALDAGYKVRVLARTPSKLATKHPNLTVVEGDFDNDPAIADTIAGATYVVCMAGGKQHEPQKYRPYFMLEFVKKLWPMMEREPNVKFFLYQAGVFENKPDGSNLWSMKYFIRPVFGYWLLGVKPGIEDNDAIIRFVDENPSKKFHAIVTRPSALKEGPGGERLEASETPPIFGRAVTFADLAAFNLRAMQDETLVGRYPFVNVARGKTDNVLM